MPGVLSEVSGWCVESGASLPEASEALQFEPGVEPSDFS